jgi:hypothetical protein
MSQISPTTFWASLGIVASAIGGLFTMQMSHANENGHSSMADQAIRLKCLRLKLKLSASRLRWGTTESC